MRTVVFAATVAMLAVSAGAQSINCALADPNQSDCARKTGAPLPAPMTSGGGMMRGPLGGYPARLDGYVCGVYDKTSGRCLVREATEEERESAYRTGVEAANNSMRLLNEINRRQGMPSESLPGQPGQNSGPRAALSTTASAPSPLTTDPAASPGNCVSAAQQRITKAAGRQPTPAEMSTILTLCRPE